MEWPVSSYRKENELSTWNKTKANTWRNLGQESCGKRYDIELADLVKWPGIECASACPLRVLHFLPIVVFS